MPLKSVSRILAAKNDNLQSLLNRAAILDGINQRLLRFLPSPLNQHVFLANIRGEDTAVIMADSSAW